MVGIIKIFVRQKGVAIAMIGLVCMSFVLIVEEFSFVTKVIATIFGIIIALVGLLMETPLLRHLKEGETAYDFTN